VQGTARQKPEPEPDRPDISVLMPSLNTGRYIERSIESVLAIEGPEIELLIQDAGSTDETKAIVDRIADPRIRFVSEPDDGQSDALNRALARARGRWIGWLNADDLYVAEGVGQLAEHFEQPLDFVYGDWGKIDSGDHAFKHYYASRAFNRRNVLDHGVFISCSGAFYRTELLRSMGGWDSELDYVADYDLLHRLARNGVRSLYVPTVVQYLREHEEAKTSRHVWGFFREGSRVALRNADGVPAGRFRALRAIVMFFVYIVTRPIWKSRIWLRIRPAKRL
jgi:glycosyltransferase involved in cell wall biosynthesis